MNTDVYEYIILHPIWTEKVDSLPPINTRDYIILCIHLTIGYHSDVIYLRWY